MPGSDYPPHEHMVTHRQPVGATDIEAARATGTYQLVILRVVPLTLEAEPEPAIETKVYWLEPVARSTVPVVLAHTAQHDSAGADLHRARQRIFSRRQQHCAPESVRIERQR